MTPKDYLQAWFALTNQPCPIDQIPGGVDEILQALWDLMPSLKGHSTFWIDPNSAQYHTYTAFVATLHR